MTQTSQRFSSRVDNYIRFRPGYPAEIINLLKEECGLKPHSIVADLGSGTGKLAEIFLANGNIVFGVEPNAAMRAAADCILRQCVNFRSVDGSAESTTLPDSSIDLVTAGQAFHWFDPEQARAECARILRPGSWAALIWNERKLDATPFLVDYEQLLLEFGSDYQEVRHDKASAAIGKFFSSDGYKLTSFQNQQVFDFEGLKGRVLSSSYIPEAVHPTFKPMLRKLEQIFDKHQDQGRVSFDYDAKVYYGHVTTCT